MAPHPALIHIANIWCTFVLYQFPWLPFSLFRKPWHFCVCNLRTGNNKVGNKACVTVQRRPCLGHLRVYCVAAAATAAVDGATAGWCTHR